MQKKSNHSPKSIVKYLKRANQVERKVLALYYLEKLGIADISEILGKNTKYVSKVLDRTLENLTVRISNSSSHKRSRLP
jgi:DNA-directed RNA polymerase specialized sigma24 family protein